MLRTGIAGLFLVLAATIISCKKDNDISPTDPVEKKLVINLQNSVVNTADIDSANVVLKKQGSLNPVFQRLIKGTTTLVRW